MQPMISQRIATSRQQQYWAEAAQARLIDSTKGHGHGTTSPEARVTHRLASLFSGLVHAAAH
jgi:hypothetical protein